MTKVIDRLLNGMLYVLGGAIIGAFLFSLGIIHPAVPISLLIASYIIGHIVDKRKE